MGIRTRVALAVAVGLACVGATPAVADTVPVAPAPPTVAADVLPTVQINGVVWGQAVVGTRVYATGSFTKARPAGSAAGTNEVTRSNILAYDLSTGALVSSWAPSLNAQGMAIAGSPDGTRVYVVGDFTSVSGVTRNRIVALDASTGAVISSFAPSLNARARAVAVTGSAVYAGGSFSVASGVGRQRLAAFSPSNGAVLPFNATAEQEILSMTAPAVSGKVVVGGRFTVLSGVSNYGLGAVDAVTGAALPWPTNQIVRDAGINAGIWSLSNDGTQVYGTGYTFGSGGNFEGDFASNTATGKLIWVTGCRGDTYSSAPIGPVLYSVSHNHDCSSIGAFPQTQPWSYQHASAFTTAQGANGKKNVSGTFLNQPAPDLLIWAPTLDIGSYTGQSQAAWNVVATSSYVLLGGEFPSINGTAQQGLARFAIKDLAPNKQGPRGYDTLTPSLSSPSAGKVKATWKAAWDRDNQRLTYEVLRGSTVVNTQVVDSNWWTRPTLSYTDTVPSGSSQTYRVRVRDPFGNSMTSVSASITVP
jgi:hypothetical protein